MSTRDLSPEDLEGLLHSHSQRYAMTQFAALEEEGDVLGAARWFVAAPFVAIVVGLVLAVVTR